MLPLHPTVKCLLERDGLIALDKPTGILSHPNSSADRKDALLDADYSPQSRFFHWKEDGKNQQLFLINRLDSATSGVILLARDEATAKLAVAAFEQLKVKKTYYALLFGLLPSQEVLWQDSLSVENVHGQLRARKGSQYPAITQCRNLFSTKHGNMHLTLAELSPRTGRTHQLRCHSAIHHVPIIGDQTYGDFQMNRQFVQASAEKRLFLHSAKLELSIGHIRFIAESPLPESFYKALNITPETLSAHLSGKNGNRTQLKTSPKNPLLDKLRNKYGK